MKYELLVAKTLINNHCINYVYCIDNDDTITNGDWCLFKHPISGDYYILCQVIDSNYSKDSAYEIRTNLGYGPKIGFKKIVATNNKYLNLPNIIDYINNNGT